MALNGILPATAGDASIPVSIVAVGIAQYPGSEANRLRTRAAEIVVETAPIRYWKDGQTPTASSGVLVQPGGVIILSTVDETREFLAIRQSGADAVLRVTYGAGWSA